jgi:hypothetical protein
MVPSHLRQRFQNSTFPSGFTTKMLYAVGRSNTGIVGSNPARHMDVMSEFFCVMSVDILRWAYLSSEDSYQKCLKGFIVSEINSDLQQATGPNQWRYIHL